MSVRDENSNQVTSTAILQPPPAPASPPATESPEMLAYRRALALHAHRQSIIQNLAAAVDHAASRLQQAAAGESIFTSDGERTMTLRLVALLPGLLARLPDKPPKEPETDDDGDRPSLLHPVCPYCRQGPGAHDYTRCPKKPPLNKLFPPGFEGLARDVCANPVCPFCGCDPGRHHFLKCPDRPADYKPWPRRK